jgi:hypothetical protein
MKVVAGEGMHLNETGLISMIEDIPWSWERFAQALGAAFLQMASARLHPLAVVMQETAGGIPHRGKSLLRFAILQLTF